MDHAEAPERLVGAVRAICVSLPSVLEHEAWTGTSWRVDSTTFAHVVQISGGWPPAYARAFETAGPTTVLTFQADPDDVRALAEIGPPFHRPPWRPGIVGCVLDEHTDWEELAELLTDSHRLCHKDSSQ